MTVAMVADQEGEEKAQADYDADMKEKHDAIKEA